MKRERRGPRQLAPRSNPLPVSVSGGTALQTTRLMLRPIVPADIDDLLSMDGDARVMRYIGSGQGPRTRDEVVASFGRVMDLAAKHPGMSLLHASERKGGRFVGGCGLFPLPDTDAIEIAYRLPYACWGQGYATEMARAVLAHGFDTLRLARIVGVTYPENLPSQRVLAKIGMRDEGCGVHYGRTMRVFAAERTA